MRSWPPNSIALGTMVLLLAFQACPVSGESMETGPWTETMEFSGFFDMLWDPDPSDADGSIFRMGQAEVDMDAALAPDLGICLAAAWNSEDESFVLATLAMNWQWSGDGLDNFCRERHLRRSGLLAGRFDVPFGIDWQVYPSIDRPLVTPPLVVQGTHGGWNADGVMIYGANGPVNASAHVTSGFAHFRYASTPDPATWTPRAVYGGRLGFVPTDWLALGGSGAWFSAIEEDHSMHLQGLDLDLSVGHARIRAEAIRHRATDADRVGTTDGVYVEGQYDLGSFYGIARWDALWAVDDADQRRLALGLGYPVRPELILRAEWNGDLTGNGEDLLQIQLAAGF